MATTSFAADITRFAKKTNLKGSMVLRKVALDAFAGVIKKSAVDTGRFRASWRVCLNQVNATVETKETYKGKVSSLKVGDYPIGSELAKFQSEALKAQWADSILISNNLPYAIPLEYGWSSQAPGGMLRITVVEVQANLQAAIKAVEQQLP